MKRSELDGAAEVLAALVARIEAGELSAPPAVVHRLTGAVIALRAVAAGGDLARLADRLGFALR